MHDYLIYMHLKVKSISILTQSHSLYVHPCESTDAFTHFLGENKSSRVFTLNTMALVSFFVFQNLPKTLNYKQIGQPCCLSTSSLEKGPQEVVIQPVQVLCVPIG